MKENHIKRSSGGFSKNKSILFRVDGSYHLGIGHVMRCLALAQGFLSSDVKSIFAIKDYDQSVTEIIQRHGCTVEIIPRNSRLEQDASLTLDLAKKHGISIIVTDLSNTDVLVQLGEYERYLRKLKYTGVFLITIDDISEVAFPSDIVINPNYGAENMNYDFGGRTKFLLGPDYFIFRQEFIEAANVDKEVKKEASNMLVAIAGSDPRNIIGKVAKAFCRVEKAPILNLRIILGINYADSARQELEGVLADFKGNYELLQGSSKMSELMRWSDIAITGAGLTKYETAVTGTPSIIISQAAHHIKIMEQFEEQGTCLHLGLASTIDEEDIAEALAKLIGDYNLRVEMSKMGRRLVGGKGIERIISEISAEVSKR